MKTVTVFEACDGQRFQSPERCQDYEQFARAVADAMQILPACPELGHYDWHQHDSTACQHAKLALVKLARIRWPDEKVWKHDATEIHVLGFAGRLASESEHCFAMAWNRLSRINWDNYREYGQPYFAMNLDEAHAQGQQR
jgi:hypothetical protein